MAGSEYYPRDQYDNPYMTPAYHARPYRSIGHSERLEKEVAELRERVKRLEIAVAGLGVLSVTYHPDGTVTSDG